MIAIDTNLLVYAHREDSDFHETALKTMVNLAEGGSRRTISWPCIHEFLAITTHPLVYRPPQHSPTSSAGLGGFGQLTHLSPPRGGR